MAVRVSAENFDAKVLQSELPVIVEFYSDSCIPCKQLSPILGGIEDDYEDKVNVYKVNVNFDAELAEKYAVMASPTILFFKRGGFPHPWPCEEKCAGGGSWQIIVEIRW